MAHLSGGGSPHRRRRCVVWIGRGRDESATAGDHHPRLGGAVAIWGFLGVVPVVRVGVLDEAGAFVEVGASLSLPAIRW